jgi:hypothetical protein
MRWLTAYQITPYSPMTASITATPAKLPSIVA